MWFTAQELATLCPSLMPNPEGPRELNPWPQPYCVFVLEDPTKLPLGAVFNSWVIWAYEKFHGEYLLSSALLLKYKDLHNMQFFIIRASVAELELGNNSERVQNH